MGSQRGIAKERSKMAENKSNQRIVFRKRFMPNKSLEDYFKKAREEGWAIGQFNISNLETLRAIVQAAKNLKSPALIGTSEGESKFLGLEQAAALIRIFRKQTGLPIFLNLDHGKTFEYIR